MATTVRDVMTDRVVALRKDADYKEIVSVLRRYRVSACPVIDDADRVIGVVSGADLLFKEADQDLPTGLVRLRWRLREESKATGVTAEELMTRPAVTIEADASLGEAARLMQAKRVKRLPVVGQDGRLVGIASRTDVLSVFERRDEEIWDEVVKEAIAGESGLDPASFEVTVSSGVVTIAGLVGQCGTALNLLARIRHTDGVVSVRDRLSYPDRDEPEPG